MFSTFTCFVEMVTWTWIPAAQTRSAINTYNQSARALRCAFATKFLICGGQFLPKMVESLHLTKKQTEWAK